MAAVLDCPAMVHTCLRRLLGVAILVSACADESPTAPLAPSSGGRSSTTTVDSDASRPPSATEDDDAGAGEAVLFRPVRNECVEVEAVDFMAEDSSTTGRFLNAVTFPEDFAVTRVVATWEGGCEVPTARISLSDGACPDGQGHEPSFLLSYNEVIDRTIYQGSNELMEESPVSGIRVRYERPHRLTPAGQWGTCLGVTGSVDLLGDLLFEREELLQGRFQLELPPCDDGGNEQQSVAGTFSVTFERGLEQLCP